MQIHGYLFVTTKSFPVFLTDVTTSGDEVKSGISAPVSAGQTPSFSPTEIHHSLKSGESIVVFKLRVKHQLINASS